VDDDARRRQPRQPGPLPFQAAGLGRAGERVGAACRRSLGA
jgi:hypothetical protein